MTNFRALTLLACGAAALAACGGSSKSNPPGPRLTRGTISSKAAGSITVNGVQLSTGGATIRVEDSPGGADDLQTGMVVTVKGVFDDRLGGAAEVEFDDNVRGRVQSVTPSGAVVVVGGVTVHVDPTTLGTSAQVGARVRVSGVPDDRGGMRATRIDDSPGVDDSLEVKGFVAAHAPATQTFDLKLTPGGATVVSVHYTGVALPAGFKDGAYVEVRSAAPVVGGSVNATTIELEDRFLGEDEVELEGIVSSGTQAEFAIDGVTVQTDGATRWENGLPGDLAAGVKVEAEGTLDAGGLLHAEKVSFRDVARVTARIVAGGTVTILGVEVTYSDFTDGIPSGSLVSGNVYQVRGYPTPDGKIVAVRVDATPSENRISLQGVATAKSAADPAHPSFTILGINVTTPGTPEFRDVNDALISPQQLSNAVEVGRTVLKVRSDTLDDFVASPPTLPAKQVEIEGED